MTIRIALIAALLFATLPARAQTNAPAAATNDVLASIRQQDYLFEIARHLYRWYLDERDIDHAPQSGPVEFRIRRIEEALDEGDRSVFAEVSIPLLRTTLILKKTDYTIPELNIHVQGGSFRITNVERVDLPATRPPDCEVVTVEMKDMRDYLLRTRNQRDYPGPELRKRMSNAVFDQMDDFGEFMKEPVQTTFTAPLSPVANEVWVFWETGRKLIQFASDIDLTNPAVWEQDELSARIYDVDKQVVVSLNEVPGSNRFLTRDQIGRALYNCVVLGEKRSGPTDAWKKAFDDAKAAAEKD